MKIVKLFAVLLVVALLSPSCAVMFGTSSYNANVESSDPNAEIYLNDSKIGTGSAKAIVARKNADNVRITIKKKDCEEQKENFDTSVLRGWSMAGTVVTWGLIGVVVDGATGAWYKPNVNDPRIEKVDLKNYTYKIDYKGCKE